MSSQQTTRTLDVKRIVYCINLDKRNEKGIPAVLECESKGCDSLNLDSRNEVLKIYFSMIENGVETDLGFIVLAPHNIGVSKFLKEWENRDNRPNKTSVEVY